MSERFIQSQYLLNQITDQFFRDKSDNIRIRSNIEPDTDNSNIDDIHDSMDDDLEKIHSEEDTDEDTYHFLETNESSLHYEFDLCNNETDLLREYTVFICGYKMVETDTLPYLQYVLSKQGDNLKFPSMQFKCATNVPIEDDEEHSAKHIYFQNECSKFIFQYASPASEDSVNNMYKGFSQSNSSENTLYVFFDLSEFSIDVTSNGSHTLCIIDEIVNTHKSRSTIIDPSVYNVFYQISDVMTIKNKWGKRITIPFLLYSCELTENGYANTYNTDDSEDIISIIDDRVNDSNYGSIYVFSSRPINNDAAKMDTLKRNVVFCVNPIYVIQSVKNNVIESGFRLSTVIPATISYLKERYASTGETKEEKIGDGQETNEQNETEDKEETKEEETKEEDEDKEETKEEDEDKEEETKEEQEDEDKEEEAMEDQEEGNHTLLDQMNNISEKKFSSVYFHEMVNEEKQSFWGVKSNIQFTTL